MVCSRHLLTAGLLLCLVPSGGSPILAHGPESSGARSASATARPVLAFYYTWYHPDTFCRCTMSDLPTRPYESGDVSTIDRQIAEATQAGITGFITSWPGPGNTQDANLALLLSRIARYDRRTGSQFVTSVYFESDADAVRADVAGAMAYIVRRYTSNPFFLRWHGKPVIFIWHPVGNGRTLATWLAVRRRVDPGHRLIWSAEGTDVGLLSVFDGLHLFSAAYWGLLDGTIGAVDQSFRARINAYNAAHRAHAIWAAGVEPGYDDTHVPGRVGAYRVPRRSGATYRASWLAAIGSRPEWVTITSFNEWFEGSMIEPSRRYGTLYLGLTRQYTSLWRRKS